MDSLTELDDEEHSPWIYMAIAGGVALVGGATITIYHKISKRNIIKKDECLNKEIARREIDNMDKLITPRDEQVDHENNSGMSSGVEIDIAQFLDLTPLTKNSDSESSDE